MKLNLYKLFLLFYRTKPIKLEIKYNINIPDIKGTTGAIGLHGAEGLPGLQLFTYDLVADPGFENTKLNLK